MALSPENERLFFTRERCDAVRAMEANRLRGHMIWMSVFNGEGPNLGKALIRVIMPKGVDWTDTEKFLLGKVGSQIFMGRKVPIWPVEQAVTEDAF